MSQPNNNNNNVCSSSSTTSSSSCLSHDDDEGDVVFVNGTLLSLKLSLSTLFDETHKPNQETKKPAHPHSSCSETNLCLELSLSVGPCSLCCGEEETTTDDSKKRKLAHQETPFVSGQNKKNKKTSSDCSASTIDGPWKIKKVMQNSDLGNMSRLLIKKEIARQFIVPMLGGAENGVKVGVFDVDTNSLHSLVFKIWPSNQTHVFIDTWVKEFVRRRDLKVGDKIGLKWDQENTRFDFSILSRAKPTNE